jgi:hypothetical protein
VKTVKHSEDGEDSFSSNSFGCVYKRTFYDAMRKL